MRAVDINVNRPIIRQVRFRFRNERAYTFDVNQNITIAKLKRMIIIAANLKKVGLRLFSNNKEYTHEDERLLEELFPNQQIVEFTFDTYAIKDDNDIISLRFKGYCQEHPGKYPYLYCYNCQQSICSLCVKSLKHNHHDIKEKYDYLQSSHSLVEGLFKNLNSILMAAKDINQESIDEFKMQISVNFNKLIQKIKQIEQSLINLVNEFNIHKTDNFEKIRANVESLKNDCAKGLDGLKDTLNIKNLIIDENVFLTIDQTLKNLENEEDRVANDVALFKKFFELYREIKDQVNQIYSKIDNTLDKILKDDSTEEIKDKIINYRIEVLTGDQLINQIKSGQKSKSNTVNRIFQALESLEKLRYAAKIQQGTNKILVYDTKESKLQTITIDFSQFNCLNNFLYNCAWCNFKDRLYFSGGLDKDVASKTFFVYDLKRNSLKRLGDMAYGHYNHSMLVHDKYLYVIGGNSNQCERFNLDTNEWSDISNLLFEQQYPVLCPYQNFLYIFFGLDINGKPIDTIQKLNLSRDNAKWEHVAYERNGCSLEMYGCGIMKDIYNSDTISFIGGKDASMVRQTTIEFNFKNHSCKKSLMSINADAYFKDSIIPQFNDGRYMAFSLQDDKLISFNTETF